MIGPEHALQVMLTKWVRAHVAAPHFFCSIDRSKATGEFTYARDKARGLLAGTPDTILIVPGRPLIAVELKAPGKKPTPRQQEIGAAIKAAGHTWFYCSAVSEYANSLHAMGVPLVGFWSMAAVGHDVTLEGAIIRREEAGGTVSKKRAAPRKAGPRYTWALT